MLAGIPRASRTLLLVAVSMFVGHANATTCSDLLRVFPANAVVDVNGGLVIEGVGTWEGTVLHLPESTVHYVSEKDRILADVRIINSVPGRLAQVVIAASQPLRAAASYRLYITPPSSRLPKAKAGFLPKPNASDDLVVTVNEETSRNEGVPLSLERVEGCAAPQCRWRGAVFTSGSSDAGRLLFVSLEEKPSGRARRMFLLEEQGHLELFEGSCSYGAKWTFGYKGEVCVRASSSSPSVAAPKLGAPVCFRLPEEKPDGGQRAP